MLDIIHQGANLWDSPMKILTFQLQRHPKPGVGRLGMPLQKRFLVTVLTLITVIPEAPPTPPYPPVTPEITLSTNSQCKVYLVTSPLKGSPCHGLLIWLVTDKHILGQLQVVTLGSPLL